MTMCTHLNTEIPSFGDTRETLGAEAIEDGIVMLHPLDKRRMIAEHIRD